jgi:hypothetical protein
MSRTTLALTLLSLHAPLHALIEWVLLVGAVEQDEFDTSLGWFAGSVAT